LLSTICQFVRFYNILSGDQASASGTKVLLDLTKLALGFCGIITCISYPRRPLVFHEGREIDAQWTGTAWSCYTYAWATPLLSMSAKGKKLDFDTIPDLDYHTRSSDLYAAFNASGAKGSLFKKLVMFHWRGIVTQYFLTFMDAIFNLAPQFAMYRLLRLLEERDAGAEVAKVAFFWVLALGVIQLTGGCLVNRMWYGISLSRLWHNKADTYRWSSDTLLQIPVRIQLGALIFAKSMRKKDIKGEALKKKSVDHIDGAIIDDELAQSTAPTADGTEVDENEEMRKTRQGVINLVGVDAKRVSDFANFNNQFFGSVCRLVVAFYFLTELVGWQSMLVGGAIQLSFLPLNIHYSKKYTDGQDILMKARDSKLAVVNEALSGIRQIKFAALERQWEKKILDARNYELKSLWRTMLADIMLIGLWLAGPTLLSAACIITYAILNGGLEPSVAFTTISMLSRVEATLAYLPELTTHALDAFISLRRISDYLSAPEKGVITQPGDQVVFENATITWPADEINDETFRLSNINIEFPKGELSVISGRTGSGKSLLLSSILGEVEVLAGTITVPSTPSPLERNDQGAHKGNWILPNAVAFVSQIPWIENCSFKDNILFGLPYDEQRYQQVISACALEKDLEILTDGDRTEIGPNGINLSGGQCWRLTLSRALYSRAGILVLDDIFSAVDAHVGKHIFEKALTGDICKDRTRILVTHHVALCLPETKYEVRLSESGVEYAGTLDEIERSGLLDAILEDEETIVDEDAVETTLDEISRRMSTASRKLSKSSSATKDHLQQRGTGQRRRSAASSVHSTAWKDDQPKRPATDVVKKFVEDEKVESGKVRWTVYQQYLKACGGFWFWFTVVVMFGGYELLLLGKVRSPLLSIMRLKLTSYSLGLFDYGQDTTKCTN
jgi:ABC-type multidrug transport system fused ATPase/permease subunit